MTVTLKNTAVAMIAAAALSSVAAFADNMQKAQAGTAAAGMPDKDQQARMMQEHMLKMHEQMHKIMDAKSPQEREKLMQEQRDTMRQHMDMMSGMMGGGMKPGMKPGAKGEAPTQDSAKPDAHQH